jgi:hypothetical protein
MRLLTQSSAVLFLTAAVAASSAVAADGNAVEQKYEALLLQVLKANQHGVCPSELMRDELKASCEAQLPDMQTKFRNLGALTGVAYLGSKPIDGGPGEIYKVSFEHGDWTWTLNAHDGKEFVAFAPAPIYNVASYSRKPVQWQSN